jgi:hypothetical protein
MVMSYSVKDGQRGRVMPTPREHFWILQVNNGDGWFAWGTSRGGLDIHAYRSKAEAAPDLHERREIHGRGNVRLTKYVAVNS